MSGQVYTTFMKMLMGARRHQILGAEVAGSFELPNVVAGSWTQVLWKNSKLSYQLTSPFNRVLTDI